MALPTVIVVHRHAATRQLIAGALGHRRDLRLISCSDADQARHALAAGPVRLLLLDLALADDAAPALLHDLRSPQARHRPARLAVFAAAGGHGIDPDAPPPDVWRVLDEPVSLLALAGCIDEALAAGGSAGGNKDRPSADETAGASLVGPPDTDPAGRLDTAETQDWPADEAGAIAAHFAGQAALFQRFKAGCLAQFAADLRDGDAAMAAADAPALRRLAHALKSVLRSLGHPADGAQALALERAAAAEPPDWPAVKRGWEQLAAALRRLRAASGIEEA